MAVGAASPAPSRDTSHLQEISGAVGAQSFTESSWRSNKMPNRKGGFGAGVAGSFVVLCPQLRRGSAPHSVPRRGSFGPPSPRTYHLDSSHWLRFVCPTRHCSGCARDLYLVRTPAPHHHHHHLVHTPCSIGMSHMAEYTCCSSVAFERPNEHTIAFPLHLHHHHHLDSW